MNNRGILIYAHNNELIDYIKIASASANLASEHLKLPVSLITDNISVNNTSILDLKNYFEHIILVDVPNKNNKRIINNSSCSFLNSNRDSAWNLTPYDHTLLIDADYFVFTDKLNQFWDIDQDFLISEGVDYFVNDIKGINDIRVSENSIPMLWATTIMFKKTQGSKLLFDLVEFIKQNQDYYSNLYNFNTRMYRNDIAFSIASHLLNGSMAVDNYKLPTVKTIRSMSNLLNVDRTGIKFVLNELNFSVIESTKSDIHFLNKIDLLQYVEEFL